ncbi:UNVERIFIED_CONTAM: hypothetical protein Slati_1329600 [Sesamum latifolium]|uniref:Uncharacterized protein n=1 Tax=Sesamum latifolium TaxID=2727402 RepID=A0AAW2XIL8_9LAMI
MAKSKKAKHLAEKIGQHSVKATAGKSVTEAAARPSQTSSQALAAPSSSKGAIAA